MKLSQDVIDEFIEEQECECDFDDLINEHLMTDAQRITLAAEFKTTYHNYNRGHYYSSPALETFMEKVFADWNGKLGMKFF